MGLFDAFSTQPAQDAAAAQTQAISAALPQIQNYYGAASNILGAGGANAAGALTGNFNTAANAATTNYMAGMQPFMQNFNTGTQGVNAYNNAMGLNGPGGNQQATQAFWNNPQIASQLQIGGENATRAANAAGGGPASGGTLAALDKYGQQVASQGWNNYVSQLSPYFNLAQSGAQGVGGLSAGLGNNLSNIYTGLGSGLAGVATGTAAGQAGLQTGVGNAMYGGLTSIGNANANADLAAYNASGNEWNAILGSLGAGSKLFGMFGGGKAKGGKVKKGKLHVVGEEGPELFMPEKDGRIIPNARTLMRIGKQPPGQDATEDNYPTGNTRMAA